MSKSLELRAERARLVEQMHAAAGTPRFRELDAKQEALKVQIQNLERADGLDRELSQLARDPQRPPVGSPFDPTGERSLTPAEEMRSTREYRENFQHFLRTGQQRDYTPMGTDVVGAGQSLVPTSFQSRVIEKMKAISQIRQYAEVLTTDNGVPIQYPTADDTSNSGHWVDENAEVTNETNPSFSSLTVGAHLISSDIVRASIQLIQDNNINLEEYLATAFARRLARGTNYAYTVGNGSTQPITGLITALVAAGGRSVTAVGANSNSGNAGDTDLNSIGSDDFAELIAKVDVAHRDGAAFMANQTTFDRLRKTKDQYGRPIWSVSLAEGADDTILGYPYLYNNDMATPAANAISLVFGNFNAGFVIRDVGGIYVARFSEKYASFHQCGFEAFLRTDAKVKDADCFAYLVHPNS